MKKFFLLVTIFLLTLIPRVYQLDQTSIYPDEVIWMVRSKETFFALKQLNFSYFEKGWWNLDKSTEAIGLPLVVYIGPFLTLLGQSQSTVSLNLFSDIAAARLPVALFNSCFLVVFFLFTKKLFNQKLALLSTILLAVDPIYIGLGRSVLQDTFLTAFTFIALSSFLLMRNSFSILSLSILTSTLAYLTKPQGLLILIAPLMLFLNHQLSFKKLFSITVFVLFTIFVLWPKNWASPSFSFITYPINQFSISTQGMRNFFFGEITYNPSPIYYLFQIFTRVPLFIAIALIASPLFFYKKLLKIDAKILSIPIFCLLYFLIMTISAKKLGPRYILPLWPWLYIFASWSVLEITKKVKFNILKIFIIVLVISCSVWSAIKFFPEHSLFYNSLIGGSKNASKYDLAGLCLGAKPSFEYMKLYYPNMQNISYLGCGEVLSPYYFSKPLTKDFKKADIVIVESTFKQLLPDDEKILYFKKITPVTLIQEKEVTLSEVYLLGEATKTKVPD